METGPGSGTEMAKKPKPKPKAMILGVRGSDAWKAWLDEFAEAARMTRVALIDVALEEFAAKKGFKPPPRR